jgi:[ribosomal protein S5]-alanine N-acetyltransferase
MHIVFETPRLTLRRFTQADAVLVQQLNSNPNVLKYLDEPPLETVEQALHILNTIIVPQYNNNLGRWAIHVKTTNEFIGWCGLKYRPERTGRCGKPLFAAGKRLIFNHQR